jgi:hypothetical protein
LAAGLEFDKLSKIKEIIAFMKVKALDDVRHKTPFEPFEIVADGRRIFVQHQDFILITPDKETAVVVDKNSRLHIVDVDHISSINILKGKKRSHP